MHIIYLVIAFALNGIANILLKVGALRGLAIKGLTFSELVGHNWITLLGLFLFALNAVFYFLALRNVPLSIAYPVMIVMSFIIINSFAVVRLSEKVLPLQLLGYGLIVGGLILVVAFQKQ